MRRPSPALVLSCLAIFLAGTGGAVAAVQFSGKQIKDGTITGKDIKNDSLTGTDIKGNVRGPEGPAGPRGATGPQGPAGTSAPVGTSGSVSLSYRTAVGAVPAGEVGSVEANCPNGQSAVGGGYTVNGSAVVVESTAGGPTIRPDQWQVVANNPSQEPVDIFVDVICITATDVSGFPPQ